MPTLTIHLPVHKLERLEAMARAKGVSANQLMDELATVALANFDARVHFGTRAARGNADRALRLLDKLDRAPALIRRAPSARVRKPGSLSDTKPR